MKKLFRKIKEYFQIFIGWIVYWFPIIVAMTFFIFIAGIIGVVIGKQLWIVWVADLLFFYLLWRVFEEFDAKRYEMTSKKKILVLLTIVLLLFIAFATLGVSMVTESRVIGNMILFPLGCFIVILLYVAKRLPNRR